MNQDERLAQIRSIAKDDREVIKMILSACADMEHGDWMLISAKALDRAADMVEAYYSPPQSGEIDRSTMSLVSRIEEGLQRYHGLRHMWAAQLANGRINPFGSYQTIDPDVLMSLQKSQLWTIIGDALSLHDLMWPEHHTPHVMYIRRGALPTHIDNMLDVTGDALDVCDELLKYQGEYAALSHQHGRMPGNDYWSGKGMRIVKMAAKIVSRVAQWEKPSSPEV